MLIILKFISNNYQINIIEYKILISNIDNEEEKKII